ncbi:hypothetical protein JYU34_008098 [Plutella xylostella]|uniref:Uncharacterized protein n=1 Tax=Plutella xylostella TaxID=51655 RepID=A0ABQ7QNQ1_PLUXY|nr:hypothetical protein JYU34_008098 [Plutella xylostella]
MSTDADKDPACPNVSGNSARDGELVGRSEGAPEKKKHKSPRKVSFPPDEDQLVTQYFEPANPWQDALKSNKVLLKQYTIMFNITFHKILEQNTMAEFPEGKLVAQY